MSIETMEYLNVSYTMRKRLPKQLDSGCMTLILFNKLNLAQKLSEMYKNLQGKIDNMMSSKAGGPAV
jgi:hypothetical protein